uniref:non-specific serine/threonine protein kinase n=2 Tax=environmental samples TaxID=651140 RepID=A0A075HEF7_9ARCH|nr:putative serine/threonine protein kinase [uncultured marine thaumarchaeote KM3_68_E02]AIF19407.1 putative serine/threonine protein kinase [uncultured marine thaumarchaeote KM3_86_G02]
MKQSFVKISKITERPYSDIWVYPKGTKAQMKSRIKELGNLGIESISFQGKLQFSTIDILGKGYVGIVVLGKIGRKKVAVKIRRNDSPRKNLRREAELLKITNQSNVGPKLVDFSKNFLVMEYLEGEKIGDWISSLKKKGSSSQLKIIIKKILEDCYKLDGIGLDHGELSHIAKHVIVGNKTTIIDFESSSVDRKVSNVTSATQAFYIGSGISKIISHVYKIPKKEKMISVLRRYKREQTRDSFEKLLDVLKL